MKKIENQKDVLARIAELIKDFGLPDRRFAIIDILPRLKPRDSWVLTPPHGYLSRLPRLTRTPQRGNALPQNVVSSMQVAVVVVMAHRTSPLPIMQ